MSSKNKKSVVFLSFANAEDKGYLQHLKKESALLRDLFLPLAENGQIELVREESLENAELPKLLNRYKNRIYIFHYGGHAYRTGLNFEDGNGYATGLAELLSLQTELKIVFLNGCTTMDQARLYLEAGIPVIIATTCAVADKDATYFAEHFYHALVNKHSIREAFISASGALRAKSSKYAVMAHNGMTVVRDTGFEESIADDLPWRLFVTEKNEAILDWQLFKPETKPTVNKKSGWRQRLWKTIIGIGIIVGIISGLIAIVQPFWEGNWTNDNMQLTLYVQGEDGNPIRELQNKGRIIVDFGNDRRAPLIGENGRTNMGEIPNSFLGEKIPITLEAEGYEVINGNRRFLMDGEPKYLIVQRDNSLGLIQGIVKNRSGDVFLAGALIMIENDTTTYSDSLGRFRLQLPPEMQRKNYSLTVKKSGYTMRSTYFKPNTTPIEIRLNKK